MDVKSFDIVRNRIYSTTPGNWELMASSKVGLASKNFARYNGLKAVERFIVLLLTFNVEDLL